MRTMNATLRLVVVGALLLSGCSSEPRPASAETPNGYRATIELDGSGAGGFEVINTATKAVMRLPGGTFSPDGTRLFVTQLAHGVATLRAIDPRSGGVLLEKPISSPNFDGRAIISANGRWLVQAQPLPGPVTRIAIFDTGSLNERDISLGGAYELDAITNSGDVLYLLESLGPNQYRVRDYDVIGGQLDATVIVDKSEASPVMNGSRVATASSANGEKVFGLYQRPGKTPFVHVLWATQKLAWCVDLPEAASLPGSSSPGWSLLLDEQRQLLFVIHVAGVISQIDISNVPRLMRTESFVPPSAAASSHLPWVKDAFAKGYETALTSGRAALSLDSQTLFIPARSGYVTVASASLHPISRRISGDSVSSLAISRDGRRLFAVQPSANLLVELDAASGRELGRFTISHPLAILRVDAA
ncbi:MAG: hypothetical protein M3Z13_05045 [Candidatus Dormibacteraeota bacterium]|nr:hypothetical protein [Candidatus Dormibacteraeota bacterium]